MWEVRNSGPYREKLLGVISQSNSYIQDSEPLGCLRKKNLPFDLISTSRVVAVHLIATETVESGQTPITIVKKGSELSIARRKREQVMFLVEKTYLGLWHNNDIFYVPFPTLTLQGFASWILEMLKKIFPTQYW